MIIGDMTHLRILMGIVVDINQVSLNYKGAPTKQELLWAFVGYQSVWGIFKETLKTGDTNYLTIE